MKNLSYFFYILQIGIVGRTGAGKSSLVQALFRMAEPSGKITIDGVVVNDLCLHDVRGHMSIIPQVSSNAMMMVILWVAGSNPTWGNEDFVILNKALNTQLLEVS